MKSISKELQQGLLKVLTRDDRQEVAKKTNFSPDYVYKVMTGDRYNEEIVKELKKLARNRLMKIEKALAA